MSKHDEHGSFVDAVRKESDIRRGHDGCLAHAIATAWKLYLPSPPPSRLRLTKIEA